MSASATGDGGKEAERVGQLTIPPTITMIMNTSETVPMSAARNPWRATGTRAATEPAVMTSRLYHRFNVNTVNQRLPRISSTELVPCIADQAASVDAGRHHEESGSWRLRELSPRSAPRSDPRSSLKERAHA